MPKSSRKAKSESEKPKSDGDANLWVKRWLAWVAVCALVVWAMEPPAPLPSDAPRERFSAERAHRWVEALAREPRVPGTEAHRVARETIVSALRDLGLATDVRSKLVFREARDHVRGAMVHNIVADLPGTGAPVVLSAHYDSVPTGPGAADDASGVAVILETLRAAKESKRRLPSIRVLITDAEEYGLLGAKAAVEDDTLPKSGVVLNFEARGGGGTVFLFETSDRNAPLASLLNAIPRPVTSSVMVSVYKRLPNDTDLTLFREAGLAGLNFAFVGKWNAYHTALDTPDRLDRRSVQQAGDSALALLLKLGEPGVSDAAASRVDGDAAWFDVLGRWVVTWPVGVSRTVAGVAGLLWLIAAVLSLRDKKGLPAFFTGLLCGVVWPVLAFGIGWVVRTYAGGLAADRPWGDPYGIRWFELSALLLLSGLGMGFAGLLVGIKGGRGGVVGSLLTWVLVTAAAAVWMPGAAHLFGLPLGIAVLALLTPKPAPALEVLAGFAWAVLLVPTLHGVWLLFGWPGLPIVLAASAFLMVPLGAGFRSGGRSVGGSVALAVFASVCAGAFGWWMDTQPSADRPRVSSTFQWVEPGNPKTWRYWRPTSGAGNGTPLTPGRELLPWLSGEYLRSPKPDSESVSLDLRRVGKGVRILPAPGATEVVVWGDSVGREIRLNGEPIPEVNGRLALRLFGAPGDGWLLEQREGEMGRLNIVESSPQAGLLEPGTIPAPAWPYPGHRLIHDSWPPLPR